MSNFARVALGIGAAALFAGCGGPQSPIDPPGAPLQTSVTAPVRTVAHRMTASSYHVLFRFGPGAGGPHGAHPAASLINVNGTMYGTTARGGPSKHGTVYSISTSGSEKVLYTFKGGNDGAYPTGLIDVNGVLYGTTNVGGTSNNGTVYSVSMSGSEKVLYSFAGGSDGAYPQASLIDVHGTLYGTTYEGGRSGCGTNRSCGTVYSISTAGAEKVLHRFKGGFDDGGNPEASLIDVNGTLYGTTEWGGSKCQCGTVYRISTTGSEKVLYSFGKSSYDGENPGAGLVDVNGTLYGTTETGGIASCGTSINCGTVYSITTTGSETILHSFTGGYDGWQPEAGLIDVNGTLYGTTSNSAYCCGAVYSITTAGSETVLHSFAGHSDGAHPLAALTAVKDTLYGTTYSGGSKCKLLGGCGTVFALKP